VALASEVSLGCSSICFENPIILIVLHLYSISWSVFWTVRIKSLGGPWQWCMC